MWLPLWKLICYLNSHCSHLHFYPQLLYALPLLGEVQASKALVYWVFSSPFSPVHITYLSPCSRLLATWPQPPQPLSSFYAHLATPPQISPTGWVEKETYY